MHWLPRFSSLHFCRARRGISYLGLALLVAAVCAPASSLARPEDNFERDPDRDQQNDPPNDPPSANSTVEDGPVLGNGSCVSAADYTLNAAPGSILSCFGLRLTNNGATCNAASFPLPRSLCGVRVSVAVGNQRIDAPLYFVSDNQINLQVPLEYAGQQAPLKLQVYRGNLATAETTIPLGTSRMAFFTQQMGGSVIGADPNVDDPAFLFNFTALFTDPNAPAAPVNRSNSPSLALRPGDTFHVILNGGGQSTPGVATGIATPAISAGERNISRPEIRVGEMRAEIISAYKTPLAAGTDQIIARVPYDAQFSDSPTRTAIRVCSPNCGQPASVHTSYTYTVAGERWFQEEAAAEASHYVFHLPAEVLHQESPVVDLITGSITDPHINPGPRDRDIEIARPELMSRAANVKKAKKKAKKAKKVKKVKKAKKSKKTAKKK